MPGKDPHRPEGKTPDMEHVRRRSGAPDQEELARREAEKAQRNQPPAPQEVPAEEQRGGSRPGVPSRVREAIAQREEREANE